MSHLKHSVQQPRAAASAWHSASSPFLVAGFCSFCRATVLSLRKRLHQIYMKIKNTPVPYYQQKGGLRAFHNLSPCCWFVYFYCSVSMSSNSVFVWFLSRSLFLQLQRAPKVLLAGLATMIALCLWWIKVKVSSALFHLSYSALLVFWICYDCVTARGGKNALFMWWFLPHSLKIISPYYLEVDSMSSLTKCTLLILLSQRGCNIIS